MSEFEQLLNEYESKIRTGEVRKGTILQIKENEVIVNIGYKHDGIIERRHLTKDPSIDLATLVEVGQEIETKVIKVNDGDGNVVLGIPHTRVIKESETLANAFANKEVLTAKIEEVVEKGLITSIDDVRIFIPQSRVNTRFEKDLSHYKDTEVRFRITEYDPKKGKVIGDCRSLIEEEKQAALDNVLSQIHEGDILEGVVKTVTKFGAFIEIGGADGLLHRTEFGWGHKNPSLKVGEKVSVFVKAIDPEKKQISLSRKFPNENPWLDAEVKYAVGTVVNAKVARFVSYGVFVNLEENIDGFIHISKIANEHIEKPEDVLKIGDVVTAKVMQLDLDEQKISLSIRDMLPKPERKFSKKENPEDAFTNPDGSLNMDAYMADIEEKEAEEKAEASEEPEA